MVSTKWISGKTFPSRVPPRRTCYYPNSSDPIMGKSARARPIHQNISPHEVVMCVMFYAPRTNGPQETLRKLKMVPTIIETHINHYKCIGSAHLTHTSKRASWLAGRIFEVSQPSNEQMGPEKSSKYWKISHSHTWRPQNRKTTRTWAS